MKPATHTLADLFGTDVRYVVPLYQRPYVWRQGTHWQPLWDDVEEILDRQLDPGATPSSHFLGAVVLEQEATPPGEVARRLVIDGQQRLTTLQLLLTAAATEASKAGAEADGRLLRALIRNNEDLTAGDARFKVWPTNANQSAFRDVMVATDGDVGPDDPNNTIHEAHAFFRQVVRGWSRRDQPSADELAKRFTALRIVLRDLLQVVSINLETGDNAQVIFETLNARGTPLLAMDLVKNALFRRAAQAGLDTDGLHDEVWQPQLGQEYWRQEKRQGRLNRPRAELFLMHWLAMKLGRIVSASELFSEFRAQILDQTPHDQTGDLIRELCAHAAAMRSFDNQAPGTEEERFFRHLEALDTTTVFPVALLLFTAPEVTPDRRRRALAAIESWLVRRMLMGLTSKNYNNLAAQLLAAAGQDLSRADERIIAELTASDAVTQAWPSEKEIVQTLVTRGLYGQISQKRVAMVLAAVELERRRASNKTENIFTLPAKLTIEHVMPQKWRENWVLTSDDGSAGAAEEEAARDAVMHRLGNLTLTSGSLNSALSNAAWSSKRTALHDHSVLLLNAQLTNVPDWGVAQINERGWSLACEMCAIWPSASTFAPAVDEQPLPTLQEALDAAAEPPVVVDAGDTSVTLADLLAAGYVDDGETLHGRAGAKYSSAVLLSDGRIECGGQVFDTPTGAAKHAKDVVAINGWWYWSVDRDDERLTLRDIRTQFTSSVSTHASPERLELADFVVAAREPQGSAPDAMRVPWDEVATAVLERTGSRPSGSQLRRLYYLGRQK